MTRSHRTEQGVGEGHLAIEPKKRRGASKSRAAVFRKEREGKIV